MRKSIIAIVLVIGMFSSCGTQSKLPSSTELIVSTLKTVFMSKDINILKPLLGENFSVGSLLGQAAIDKAGSLLKSGPNVTDVLLKGVEKTSSGTVLNTMFNVEGQEAQASPIALDNAGKINSIGFLTSLLGAK